MNVPRDPLFGHPWLGGPFFWGTRCLGTCVFIGTRVFGDPRFRVPFLWTGFHGDMLYRDPWLWGPWFDDPFLRDPLCSDRFVSS